MAKRTLTCPKCNHRWEYGYWQWVWKAQFHWPVILRKPLRIRDSRLTMCPKCGTKSWIYSEK